MPERGMPLCSALLPRLHLPLQYILWPLSTSLYRAYFKAEIYVILSTWTLKGILKLPSKEPLNDPLTGALEFTFMLPLRNP